MLHGWGSPDSFRLAPVPSETTVKANLLCKHRSSGCQIQSASKLDSLQNSLYLVILFLFISFTFGFNSLGVDRRGNLHPCAHPAEAVIDLPQGEYASGAGCKEQWKGMCTDSPEAHPAVINRIDLLRSQECSGVKLYYTRADSAGEQPCKNQQAFVFFFFPLLFIWRFVKWRLEIAWLHNPNWGRAVQSSHGSCCNCCFDMEHHTSTA